MINNDYIQFLDGLNDQERSVFFYHIVLQMSVSDVCEHLKLKRKTASNICRFLKAELDFWPLRQDLYEAFLLQER